MYGFCQSARFRADAFLYSAQFCIHRAFISRTMSSGSHKAIDMLQTEKHNCIDSLSYVDVGAGVSLLFEPRRRLDDHVYCLQSGFSSVCSSASTVVSTLSRTDASISFTNSSSNSYDVSRNLPGESSAELRPGSNSICLLGEQSVEVSPYDQTCHQGFGVHKRFRSTDDLHPYWFSEEMQHKRHRANTTSDFLGLQRSSYPDVVPQSDLSNSSGSTNSEGRQIGISSIPDRAHFSALAAAAHCIWATTRATASSSAAAMSRFPSTVSPSAATFGHESFAPVPICRSYAPHPMPHATQRRQEQPAAPRAAGSGELAHCQRERQSTYIEEYSLGSGYPG
jgi:hypothetical protein